MRTTQSVTLLFAFVFCSVSTARAQVEPANPNVDEAVARCQDAIDGWGRLPPAFGDLLVILAHECGDLIAEEPCREASILYARQSIDIEEVLTVCLEAYCPLFEAEPLSCDYDLSAQNREAKGQLWGQLRAAIIERDIGPYLASTPPRNLEAPTIIDACARALAVEEASFFGEICSQMFVEESCREAVATFDDSAEHIDQFAHMAAGCLPAYCPILPEPRPDLCGLDFESLSMDDAPLWREFEETVLAFDNGSALIRQWHIQVRGLAYVNALSSRSITFETTPELEPPVSTSTTAPSPDLVITITTDSVWIEDELVVDLVDGLIPESDRFPATSPNVPAIQLEVEERAEDFATPRIFSLSLYSVTWPVATIVADRTTPYDTLVSVMMSASVGGMGTFESAVAPTIWQRMWEGSAGGTQANVIAYFSPTDQYFSPIPHSDEPIDDGPRILLGVTNEGLVILDTRETEAFVRSGLGRSITGCSEPLEDELAMTICLRPDVAETAPLLERLDYRGLYNRVVEIRDYPEWADALEADIAIHVLADRDVPLEVLVRVLDVIRWRLDYDETSDDDSFFRADYLEDDHGRRQWLFPTPFLLIPRGEESVPVWGLDRSDLDEPTVDPYPDSDNETPITLQDFETWRNREGSEEMFVTWMLDPESSAEVRAKAIEMLFEQYNCMGCSGAENLPRVGGLPAEQRDQAILDALSHIRALLDGQTFTLGTEQLFELDPISIREGTITLFELTDNSAVHEALRDQIFVPWFTERYQECAADDLHCREGELMHFDPCLETSSHVSNAAVLSILGQDLGLPILTQLITQDPPSDVYCLSSQVSDITWYPDVAEDVMTSITQRLENDPPVDSSELRTLISATLSLPDSVLLKDWIFGQLLLPEPERTFPLYRDIVDAFWEYSGSLATETDAEHYAQLIVEYAGALRWNAFSQVVRLRGAPGLELALDTLATLPAETDWGYIDGQTRENGYMRAVQWLCQRDLFLELGDGARLIYEQRINADNIVIQAMAIQCLGYVGNEDSIAQLTLLVDDATVIPAWGAEDENTLGLVAQSAIDEIRGVSTDETETPDDNSLDE